MGSKQVVMALADHTAAAAARLHHLRKIVGAGGLRARYAKCQKDHHDLHENVKAQSHAKIVASPDALFNPNGVMRRLLPSYGIYHPFKQPC